MRYLFGCIFCVLVMSGCGVATPTERSTISGELGVVLGEDHSEQTEIPDSWGWYENERYGYRFAYPVQGQIWERFEQDASSVVLERPTVTSQQVYFTDVTEPLEDLETANYLAVEVYEGQRSAHEWITQHLDQYFAGGNAGQKTRSFAGEDALLLVGQGKEGSPAKMIVLQHREHVFLIWYRFDSFTLEQIYSTFSFVD